MVYTPQRGARVKVTVRDAWLLGLAGSHLSFAEAEAWFLVDLKTGVRDSWEQPVIQHLHASHR